MAITKQNTELDIKELHLRLQSIYNEILRGEEVLENSTEKDRMYICDTVLSVNICLTGNLRELVSGAIHMRLDELRKEYKQVLKELSDAQKD